MTAYAIDPHPIRPEPRLWSLYTYCRDKACCESGAEGLPAWADIDRPDLARWRRNLMLIRFHGDVTHYEIEWEGAGLQQYYGSRRAGHGLETLTATKERDLLIQQYGAALASRQPAYFDTAFTDSDGVFAHQAKLILPLSSDHRDVDRVLVGIYFRGINNIVDIVGRLDEFGATLVCPRESPSRIASHLAAVAAKRDRLGSLLRRAEKRATAQTVLQLAAKIRTTMFIVADMAMLEGRMIESGRSWPWDETRDDLTSLFDFGLRDLIHTDLAEIDDTRLMAGALAALEEYRDALLAVGE